MTSKSLSLLILLMVSLVACKNNNDPTPANKNDYVPGDVVIGIKSNVPINLVFDLMNEKGVSIDEMSGFLNYSTLPNDSLDYLKNMLKGKVYLNKRGFTGGSAYFQTTDNRIVVTDYFFEMDKAAQQDWLATMDTLKLHDLQTDTKNLLIKVKPGKEVAWVNQFKKHPYVKWAELNKYVLIDPL